MSVGVNIKKERMEKSISQETLGKAIGMSKANISKIESGQIDPSVETLAAIAKALGCNPVDFFHEGATRREDTAAFWERVKSTCAKKDIKQFDLYKASDLDPKVAFHWSNVCILPSTDAVLKFAAYLDVDVYWLVYGDEIPNEAAMAKKLEEKKPMTLDGALAEIDRLRERLAELEGRKGEKNE